jgi:hypothetical protein
MQPVTDLRHGLAQHEDAGDEALLAGPSVRDLTSRPPLEGAA